MMRQFLFVFALVLTVMLVLVACGGDDDAAAPAPPPPPAEPALPPAEPEPAAPATSQPSGDDSAPTSGSTASAGSDAATTSAASATTSSVGEGGVLVVEDEPYRESTSTSYATTNGLDSTVDIFVGDGNGGAPLVVLLHGYSSFGPGRPDDDLGPLGEEIARLGSTVFYFGWQTALGFSADSVADLSCVGPFVAARAAEYGADPDNVIVVGHSMGAATGAMLAFSTFNLAASPDCTETGQASSPVAFLGTGGSYGVNAKPLDDTLTRFRVRTSASSGIQELDADEELTPGLSAAQLYEIDGYSAIPPVAELEIVLLVGSEDQYPTTDGDVTAAFAEALEANNIYVDVVTLEGANHDNVVDPTSEHGQTTLQVIADILTNTR